MAEGEPKRRGRKRKYVEDAMREEMQERRKNKNRESASESRHRKKLHINALQEEFTSLTLYKQQLLTEIQQLEDALAKEEDFRDFFLPEEQIAREQFPFVTVKQEVESSSSTQDLFPNVEQDSERLYQAVFGCHVEESPLFISDDAPLPLFSQEESPLQYQSSIFDPTAESTSFWEWTTDSMA
jgi:hypothetical protein